jgi:choline kinase
VKHIHALGINEIVVVIGHKKRNLKKQENHETSGVFYIANPFIKHT